VEKFWQQYVLAILAELWETMRNTVIIVFLMWRSLCDVLKFYIILFIAAPSESLVMTVDWWLMLLQSWRQPQDLHADNAAQNSVRSGCCCSRDGSLRTYTLTTLHRTLSGQSRWMWIRLEMNYVMLGVGYVYDVDSILATFYESSMKPVNFMAIKALPVTCHFVVPYQLYNGTRSTYYSRPEHTVLRRCSIA